MNTVSEAPQNRKSSLKKWLTPIFLWIPIAVATGNMVVSVAGVCISQASYWTNDELIEVAVREHAKLRYSDGTKTMKEMAIDETEEAVQQFLKDNPKCCAVDRNPHYRGFLDFLVGWNTPEVEVNYQRHPDSFNFKSNNSYYQKYFTISTCGEFIKSGRGMSTDILETTRHTRQSK